MRGLARASPQKPASGVYQHDAREGRSQAQRDAKTPRAAQGELGTELGTELGET